MATPVWLRRDAILALHRRLLAEHGGADGLRDPGGLEAALARPRQMLAYEASADLAALAAAIGVAFSRNPPFVDGNKRIAALATILFLERNGLGFVAGEAEVVAMFRLLAAGEMNEAAFAAWLRQNVRRARPPRKR